MASSISPSSGLDPALVAKVKGLKMEYTDKPQPDLLIRVPNPSPETDYEVESVAPEFTSQCPLNTTQPDTATITIHYKPGKWCVELKSLKFYLNSFREVPIFHEAVPTTILTALVALLEPKWIVVNGRFGVRGGISTNVRAVFNSGSK